MTFKSEFSGKKCSKKQFTQKSRFLKPIYYLTRLLFSCFTVAIPFDAFQNIPLF